jgi:hypothetical protein
MKTKSHYSDAKADLTAVILEGQIPLEAPESILNRSGYF